MTFPEPYQLTRPLRALFNPGTVLALLISVSIFELGIPFGIPLVLPLAAVVFGWFFFVKQRTRIPTNAGFLWLSGAILFYVAGILKTGTVFPRNVTDGANAVGALLFGVCLYNLDGEEEFRQLQRATIGIGAVGGSVLAVIGLYKYHLMARGETIARFWIEGRPYPWGTSLVVDYNFYAFSMLCGAISCLFGGLRSRSVTGKVLGLLGFLLCAISMSLSGSRRGWVTEALLLGAVGLSALVWLVNNLFRLRFSAFLSKHLFQSIVAMLVIAIGLPYLLKHYTPAFLDSNRADFTEQTKDMQYRLNTLNDPKGSFEGRSDRWEYAKVLMEGGTPGELIFGQGFDYLHEFAVYFNMDHVEDYPHNPVISAALYSGLVGAVYVSVWLLAVSLRYWRSRRFDQYFLVLYFASLWFVIPSFDSAFSGKFFPFFLLLPWSIPLPRRQTHAERIDYSPQLVHSRL